MFLRNLSKSLLRYCVYQGFKKLKLVVWFQTISGNDQANPKNVAHIKSGEKWNENNHLATFTKVQSKSPDTLGIISKGIMRFKRKQSEKQDSRRNRWWQHVSGLPFSWILLELLLEVLPPSSSHLSIECTQDHQEMAPGWIGFECLVLKSETKVNLTYNWTLPICVPENAIVHFLSTCDSILNYCILT